MEGVEEAVPVDKDEAKACKRTLRALKHQRATSTGVEGGESNDGEFTATIRHFSGLFLAHKAGQGKLSGVAEAESGDPSCAFVFEPFRDTQMGRPRKGLRIRTAQGSYLVAVLGRRCTCRLVAVADVPEPGSALHPKFFAEQTDIFELDAKSGGLRYQHHSSANDDDVFFFAFAPVSGPEIVRAECELRKGDVPADWKYLVITRK